MVINVTTGIGNIPVDLSITFSVASIIKLICPFSKIISFLQFQKERLEKAEINAGTLSNFVKSIKLYCEMYDISIRKHCFIGIELLKNDKFY
jgi:hypothetical protein